MKLANGILYLLNTVQNAQVSDTTGDAMKYYSRVNKKINDDGRKFFLQGLLNPR